MNIGFREKKKIVYLSLHHSIPFKHNYEKEVCARLNPLDTIRREGGEGGKGDHNGTLPPFHLELERTEPRKSSIASNISPRANY